MTADRAASARVATLATIGLDGAPHLVPCVFVLTGDTLYTPVDAKPKSTRDLQRLRDIARDPRVSILIHEWHEDWRRLWWVRLDGRARVLPPGDELDRARDLLLAKYAQYRRGDELDPVIAVDVHTRRTWSAAPDA